MSRREVDVSSGSSLIRISRRRVSRSSWINSRSSQINRQRHRFDTFQLFFHFIKSFVGMKKMEPPIRDLLPRLTPILKNRHEKVQENCIDLVGRIADRGAEYVSAREWMRICFELLELLKVLPPQILHVIYLFVLFDRHTRNRFDARLLTLSATSQKQLDLMMSLLHYSIISKFKNDRIAFVPLLQSRLSLKRVHLSPFFPRS